MKPIIEIILLDFNEPYQISGKNNYIRTIKHRAGINIDIPSTTD